MRRVHCARDARAWCECASARSRNPGCGVTSAAMGLASLVLEEQRQELEDVEDVEELTKTLIEGDDALEEFVSNLVI